MTKGLLFERIETYFVVTVITVLIWMYAEGEIVDIHTETVRVGFVAKTGLDLSIVPQHEVEVEITFEASNAKLDEIQQVISNSIQIEMAPAPNGTGQREPVDIAVRLNDQIKRETGVIVTSTRPPVIDVLVQEMQEVQMTVDPPVIEAVTLTEWTTEPTTVTVKMPDTLARTLSPDLAVIAKLDFARLRTMEAGVPQSENPKLSLPPELQSVSGIQISPSKVHVSYSIIKRNETLTLGSVPIHIMGPPGLLTLYDIELPPEDQVLPDVELEGPVEVIERIRVNELRVVALIIPTREQLESASDALPVTFFKPDSVTVKTPPKSVSVTITAR